MPSREEILGFGNRWYTSAIQHALRKVLPNHIEIAVVDGPHFIATKLEAFASRGDADMYRSHDLEDIIAVFNGRSELPTEIAGAPDELKTYVSRSIFHLTSRAGVLEVIEGHLASMTDSKNRAATVLGKLWEVASYSSSS
jgi:hypothetical protein